MPLCNRQGAWKSVDRKELFGWTQMNVETCEAVLSKGVQYLAR
jgi:hypothetical protein